MDNWRACPMSHRKFWFSHDSNSIVPGLNTVERNETDELLGKWVFREHVTCHCENWRVARPSIAMYDGGSGLGQLVSYYRCLCLFPRQAKYFMSKQAESNRSYFYSFRARYDDIHTSKTTTHSKMSSFFQRDLELASTIAIYQGNMM